MIKTIMKIFSGNGADAKASDDVDKGARELEHLVDYIVRALVDYPEAVRVSSEVGKELNTIKINCKKEDIGKIVGKRGKTIMAIRSLVNGAAGRLNKKVAVEVVD